MSSDMMDAAPLGTLTLALPARRAASAVLRREKGAMALRANDVFYARHPEWMARFGAAGMRRGVEDAAFHIDFLAGALEAGEPAAFVAYVTWLLEVLRSRGIAGEFVAESLDLIGNESLLVVNENARDAVRTLVRAGVARASRAPDKAVASASETPSDGSAFAPFLQALLQGERQGAVGIAREALRVAAHPSDVYVGLFQRSLEEVGRLWQRNAITVAREHMATACVQFVLAQLYPTLDRSAPPRGTALVTGVEGELHQVGANLVADALEMDGWRVRFLGTDVPHEGIIAVLEEVKADIVGISATMLFNVDPVARLIESVRAMKGGTKPRVLVGGGAFRGAPQLWREIGADGFAVDLRDACVVARGGELHPHQ